MITLLIALSLFQVFGVPHPNASTLIVGPGVTIPPNFSGNYSKENYTLSLLTSKLYMLT